jgi:hypothetical protein
VPNACGCECSKSTTVANANPTTKPGIFYHGVIRVIRNGIGIQETAFADAKTTATINSVPLGSTTKKMSLQG